MDEETIALFVESSRVQTYAAIDKLIIMGRFSLNHFKKSKYF